MIGAMATANGWHPRGTNNYLPDIPVIAQEVPVNIELPMMTIPSMVMQVPVKKAVNNPGAARVRSRNRETKATIENSENVENQDLVKYAPLSKGHNVRNILTRVPGKAYAGKTFRQEMQKEVMVFDFGARVPELN